MTSPVLDGSRAALHQRKILRSRAEMHFDNTKIVLRTIDISTTGISAMSQHSLPAGITCTILFQLPISGKLHDVTASVKILYNSCQGTDGFRLGLRFTDLDPERSSLIEHLY